MKKILIWFLVLGLPAAAYAAYVHHGDMQVTGDLQIDGALNVDGGLTATGVSFNMLSDLSAILWATSDNWLDDTSTDGNHVLSASEIDDRITAGGGGGGCYEEQVADYTAGTLTEGCRGYSTGTGKTFFKSTTGFYTSPDWGYVVDSVDCTPTGFGSIFQADTDATLSTSYEAGETYTVAGVDGSACVISVTGTASVYEYEKNNSGTWTSSDGTITDGDVIAVRQTSSASNSTDTTAIVSIGTVDDTYTVTTVAGGADASDDFNRINEAPIAGNWSTASGFEDMDLDNDILKVGTLEGGVHWNAHSFTNDQYAQSTYPNSYKDGGPSVRISGSGAKNGYMLSINGATSGRIIKYDNGAVTVPTTFTFSVFDSADIWRIEISGETLTVKQNGSVIDTHTDTGTTLTSGSAGIIGRGNGAWFDDFEAGDL